MRLGRSIGALVVGVALGAAAYHGGALAHAQSAATSSPAGTVGAYEQQLQAQLDQLDRQSAALTAQITSLEGQKQSLTSTIAKFFRSQMRRSTGISRRSPTTMLSRCLRFNIPCSTMHTSLPSSYTPNMVRCERRNTSKGLSA